MTAEARAKSNFRKTSKWKNFRKRLKKERRVDEVTQKPLYKGFEVHHCDMSPEHYTTLNPINFVACNKKTHEVIHWLFSYADWRGVLMRLYVILEKMEKLNKKHEKAHSEESA